MEKRRYCATKLVGKLRGPARLLAMSWTTMEFDHVNGTRELLQRLAASPLVRQTLPNAAATCQQYFSFRREHGEAMNNFLVREALGYSEFVESLLLLYEDKNGIKQHEKSFDLPEEVPQSQEPWYDWWQEEERANDIPPGFAAPPEPSGASAAAAADGEVPDAGDGSVGGGASTAAPPLQRARTPRSLRSVGVPSTATGAKAGTIDEFSLADSFVLGVLRGFRLLQSAGLSAEEKRDILSATKGSLEFSVITQALQTLWDEQFLGRAAPSQRSSLATMAHNFHEVHAAVEAEDWSHVEHDGMWADADAWHDSSWDDWHEAQHGQQDELPPEDPPDDQAIRESLQAEKEAESLALQAQRTWSEAQRATAALRRDRGFGQSFKPNTSHYARDCPDKYHPAVIKGKGKGKSNFAAEWEYEEAYYSKGKPKGYGRKGKSMNHLEANALWKGKGKSRPAMPRAPVNAYASETFYGMEMKEPLELQATSSSRLEPGSALLDCGATASAGPEESVKSLINSVLAADKQTSITIAKYMRPFFRFGNGRWGQANYRVTLTSCVSGRPRSFHLYCLPNPPEINKPDFDKNNLVPVLLGMDHLSGRESPESALTVDFHTGLAIESLNPVPTVHQLPSNSKGHYVRNIVEYLTMGKVNTSGSPTIHVLEGAVQSAELQTLEFHPVEFYGNVLTESLHAVEVATLEKSKKNLLMLHARIHECALPAEAHSASMCPRDNSSPNSKVSASLLHGAGTSTRWQQGHGGAHQVDDSQEGGIQAPGSQEEYGHGQPRSSMQPKSMALLRTTPSSKAPGECTRRVGSLRSVQFEDQVHPQGGQCQQHHQGGEQCHGQPNARATPTFDAGLQSNGNHLLGNAEEDRRRGDFALHRGQGDREAEQHRRLPAGEVQGKSQSGIGGGSTTSYSDTELFGINVGSGADISGDSNKLGPRDAATSHCGGEGANHEGSERSQDGCKSSYRGGNQLGQRLRVRDELKEKPGKNQSLHPRMAAKVMLMATTMMSMATSTLASFALDDRDGLWEIACAPHSWLSEAAQQHGLRPRRINLEAGYDLTKEETWRHLRELRRRHRPRRLWWSLPCTHWCPWTSLNYSTEERKVILENLRRKDRKVLKHAEKFLEEALEEDPEILVYWEWPHPCFGWSQRPMQNIEQRFHQHGHDWEPCRIDGCRYDMRDSEGELLRKRWLIRTNDNSFHNQFRAKVCIGHHCHGRIEGRETQKSAYYPWKLVMSIAKFWSGQTTSNRQVRRMSFHDVAEVELDCEHVFAADEVAPLASPGDSSLDSQPSDVERERWQVRLTHFHKSAGHCSSRNLARIVKDANLESWKVKMASEFKCPTCESLKPGGISSGNVPPAATHAQFGPWEALGLDVAEWTIPGKITKQKFLLMIDMATRLRLIYPLMEEYDITTMKIENSEMVIKALSLSWLATYPKPHIIVADNAKSFTSEKFGDFCRDSGIELSFPAEKEAWAHGLVEHAIKDLKFTASAIQLDNMTQDPVVSLVLAASALNSTEFVSGFSSHQWAFGRDFTVNEEERRIFGQLGDRATFASMVAARQRAEEVANKSRAQRILTRLGNSKARQPIRQFEVADLVMVWRQVLPSKVHTGPRGGMKKSSRPGWVGPGRVIFTEMLPHQSQDDPRRHIVWVLMQGKLLRCSVHSVRPVTPTEKLHHELNSREDITRWRSLEDLLPRREFTDITDEIPDPEQLELPHLPPQPDDTTIMPIRRAVGKKTLTPDDWKTIHRLTPLGVSGTSVAMPFGLGGSNASSSHRPSDAVPGDGAVNDYGSDDYEPESPYEPPGRAENETAPEEPEAKRARSVAYDLKWVEQLEADAAFEQQSGDIFEAFMDTEDFIMYSFDIRLESNRQRKMFERNPVLYLTKKMNGAEVQLARLSEHEKRLFHRAKMKEVTSFIKNEQ